MELARPTAPAPNVVSFGVLNTRNPLVGYMKHSPPSPGTHATLVLQGQVLLPVDALRSKALRNNVHTGTFHIAPRTYSTLHVKFQPPASGIDRTLGQSKSTHAQRSRSDGSSGPIVAPQTLSHDISADSAKPRDGASAPFLRALSAPEEHSSPSVALHDAPAVVAAAAAGGRGGAWDRVLQAAEAGRPDTAADGDDSGGNDGFWYDAPPPRPAQHPQTWMGVTSIGHGSVVMVRAPMFFLLCAPSHTSAIPSRDALLCCSTSPLIRSQRRWWPGQAAAAA
jgi:hypothetical protein